MTDNRPPLRTLLRANALFASATGLTALALTGPVADLVGAGEHRLVSGTGLGLLFFALGLMIASGASTSTLVRAGRLVTLADGIWVAATVAVVGLADLPLAGIVTLAVIGAIVASFALLQLRVIAAMDTTVENQVVDFSRVLSGTVEDVWAAVIDHEAYGRLAPNLSKVVPTGPNGPNLTRRCWDTKGRHWDEACVLWSEGECFAVVVDTAAADYPYPLDFLRGEWSVHRVGPNATRVTVRFELRPSPGPAGSAFATAMTTGAKPLLRRVTKGWQEIVSPTPSQRSR